MIQNLIRRIKGMEQPNQRTYLGAGSALAVAVLLLGCSPNPPEPDPVQACIDSGGTVATMPCTCEGVSDFPDSCLVGLCTCPPDLPSYDVRVCVCGEDRCFDGTECVLWEDIMGEQACVDSGGTVATAPCNCEGVSNFYDTCAVGACTCAPEFPSYDVTVCDCGEDRCFDGIECVLWEDFMGEQACVDSGGTVATAPCNCEGVSNFYDTCAVGACTCPPEFPSYDVTVCDCGEDRCFNGTECVRQGDSTLEQACVDSGGTVATAPCNCEGVSDYYDTCAVGACTCSPDFPSYLVTICDCGEDRCFDGTECVSSGDSTLEQACIGSGGTVATMPCNCEGVSDFYDNCAVGACTCPPEFPSYDVTVCDCGEDRCFDGTECVSWEDFMLEQACIGSGGTVATAPCNCEGVSDFYDTCAVGACTCPPEFPSYDVTVCDCGEDRCFDGTECVSWEDSP